jgi:hypothetical protein
MSFSSTIACLVSGIKKYKSGKVISKDIKTEEDCDALASKKTYKNGEKCPFWSDDSQCRYGIYNSSKCSEKKTSATLLILAGIFALITFILLIFYIKGYKKQTREYYSPELPTDKKEGFFSRLFERIFGTKKRAEEKRREEEQNRRLDAEIKNDKIEERQIKAAKIKKQKAAAANKMIQDQENYVRQKVKELQEIARNSLDNLKQKQEEALIKLNHAVNGPGNMNAKNIAKYQYDTARLEYEFAKGNPEAFETRVRNMMFDLTQKIIDKQNGGRYVS